MLQYDLNITRQLSQCEGIKFDQNGKIVYEIDAATGLATTTPKMVDEIAFSISAKADELFVPGESYLIDHTSLGAETKTSSITMDFYDESLTLKSINLAAEDKTGEVIKSVTSTLVGIASIAYGLPTPSSAAAAPPPEDYLVCTDTTKTALNAIKTAQTNVKSLTDSLKDKTKELNEEIESIGKIATIGALSDSKKSQLSQLATEQRMLMVSVANAGEKLATLKKPFQQSTTLKWPQTFTSLQNTAAPPFTLSAADRKKWHALFEVKDQISIDFSGKQFCPVTQPVDRQHMTPVEKAQEQSEVDKCLDEKLKMSAVLRPAIDRSGSINDSKAIGISSIPVEGILYRQPDPGYLRVCKALDPIACATSATEEDIVLASEKPVMVPQLGQLRFLKFKNEPFQNNQLVLALRKNGALEKFEYKDLAAQAAGAAAAASDTISQLGAFATAMQKFEDEQKTKEEEDAKAKLEASRQAIITERADEIATLQYQIDLLNKQKEVTQLTNPSDTATIDSLSSQTAEINARVALLKAKLAEVEAEAALAGDS
ncbi:MAG: hypothetical protein RH945_06260 [Hyphomonas sp.]